MILHILFSLNFYLFLLSFLWWSWWWRGCCWWYIKVSTPYYFYDTRVLVNVYMNQTMHIIDCFLYFLNWNITVRAMSRLHWLFITDTPYTCSHLHLLNETMLDCYWLLAFELRMVMLCWVTLNNDSFVDVDKSSYVSYFLKTHCYFTIQTCLYSLQNMCHMPESMSCDTVKN